MANKKKDDLRNLRNKSEDKYNPSDHPDDSGKLSPGPGRESFKLAAYWKEQVKAVDEANSRWIKKSNAIIKRFRDERSRSEEDYQRRMNVLWAYVKILKPALYGKCPIPNIERKFLDRDPTGRLSAVMLERSVRNEIKMNGLHGALNKAVLDYLLPGRGVIWPRYEPEFGEAVSLPAGDTAGTEDELIKIIGEDDNESSEKEQLESTGTQLIAEKVPIDYIDFKDFYIFPVKARTWAEVKGIGKKVFISKKEAKERFGDEIGSKLQPDTTPMNTNNDRRMHSDVAVFHDINERSICAFEIWNKPDRRVYWYSTGYDYLCDVVDDPYKLKDFFPIPEPISATLTNDSLIPVPDFSEWQDQAIQIDELTQRIAMLTKACKVAGAYDASAPALARILNEDLENQLIPVDAWAAFAEKGGIKGAMAFLPLDEIQAVIATLREVRAEAKQDLDEITGVNDVMRGTTDSRETLGGIRLKNNNTGTRLSDRQDEIARFARDTIAIVAEIIAKHFSDESIIDSSGILYDEELDPEFIIMEMQVKQEPDIGAGQGQQGQGTPQLSSPMQSQQSAPQSPLGPSMPSAQQPGTNIVPFPGAGGGAQGQLPQQGITGAPAPIPLRPQHSQIDPYEIIALKINKALDLLRKDITRFYRIEIETDSTIYGDRSQEKQDATEFITAMTAFMTQASQIGGQAPEALPLMGRFLQWGVRKFRTGRDLESAIDLFVVKMDKKAKDMIANPQPDKDQKKVDAEIQIKQMEYKAQSENDQRDMQRQQQQDQRKSQLEAQDDARKMEMQKREDDRAQQLSLMEMQFKKQEYAFKERELLMKEEIAKAEHSRKMQELGMKGRQEELKIQTDIQKSHIDHNLAIAQGNQAIQQSEREHQQKLEQMKQQSNNKSKQKKVS